MKKIVSLMMALLLFVLPFVSVDAKEEETKKVKFYIFYGETCSFCNALHEFTDKLEKDKEYKDMFEIVDYEVWSNAQNADLMTQVGAYLNVDASGVPFYVIGEQAFSGYSDESSPDKIKKAIEDAYNDEDYRDIVAGIGEGSLTVEDKTLTEEDEDNDIVGYIILGITAVIVIVIICSRSGDTYYDENSFEEDEKVVEEETSKEEEETETTTTTKKTNNKTTKKTNNNKKK